MVRRMRRSDDGQYQLATSHFITTCSTLAAIILFVILGSAVIPDALGGMVRLPSNSSLTAVFILNIAIVLFGWRRAKELGDTLAALKRAENETRIIAYTDHTTGLSNRRALVQALEHGFEPAPGGGALILADLDHFKRVNDLYGHGAGDELLRFTGTVLRSSVPEAALAARLGGDEFAVLMADGKGAEAAARKIVEAFAQPIRLGDVETLLSVSVGVAPILPGDPQADIMHRADVAMYSVKQSGRNGFAWFDARMDEEVQARVLIEEDIRKGIEAGEFLPYFQPLIHMDSGELNGFEVLARWDSPSRGLVEPADFIGAAEQCGQIGALSLAVMEKAFIEAKDWPADIKLAVNVSTAQFRDPQLAERIVQLLTATGFQAHRLEIEIAESSLIEDRAQALTIIESLRNHGIAIALDDFGTGYASLSQLHSLPFDRIKIDRRFITALAMNSHGAAIVETIASLGKALSVPITAEGIENEAVRAHMAALGCTDAQGWLFGKAVAGDVASRQLGSNFPASGPCKPLDPPHASDDRLGKRRSAGSK